MPNIEMELEYAYNCWRGRRMFDDETAKSLKQCMARTAGSEIDKAAIKYPRDFIDYVDVRVGQV